ncbi:MAG: DUF4238 domain-containing protein [Acidobacteriaceae bacterium]
MIGENKRANRRDHYLPQGYLRGFIDPGRKDRHRPLWYLDIRTGEWSEKSPRQVGYEDGFYDYAGGASELVHPDITFARLEREFPVVRDRLIDAKFDGWTSQLGFFLSYMQMMRARSPLFLAQKAEENKAIRGWTVKAIGPAPNQVTLESMESAPMSDVWVRNRTIVQMREEVEKDPSWMRAFHWCLRYTESPCDPVVTVEQPLVSAGPRNNPVNGLHDSDTLIYFPLCWQACLIGNVHKFNVETEKFAPVFLQSVRRLYRNNTAEFIISPQRLADL